jgi:hypothetical protein
VNSPAGPCAVAFKEWAGVCDALLEGEQSIIVRKGGISEGPGPGVFVPEHAEFWLYPTGLHQAQQGLRRGAAAAPAAAPTPTPAPTRPADADESLRIRAWARVELTGYVQDEATLRALEEFHVFTEETIRKRFHYRTPGLWVLGARIWRREPAFAITPAPEHAGCKTWVILDPALPLTGLTPVLDDTSWAACRDRLRSILASSPSRREHA